MSPTVPNDNAVHPLATTDIDNLRTWKQARVESLRLGEKHRADLATRVDYGLHDNTRICEIEGSLPAIVRRCKKCDAPARSDSEAVEVGAHG